VVPLLRAHSWGERHRGSIKGRLRTWCTISYGVNQSSALRTQSVSQHEALRIYVVGDLDDDAEPRDSSRLQNTCTDDRLKFA
jgi:hypothetical protein